MLLRTPVRISHANTTKTKTDCPEKSERGALSDHSLAAKWPGQRLAQAHRGRAKMAKLQKAAAALPLLVAEPATFLVILININVPSTAQPKINFAKLLQAGD